MLGGGRGRQDSNPGRNSVAEESNRDPSAEILVLEMSGIELLLGNDVLKKFKRLEIEYGEGKPRFGKLPVGLLTEVRGARKKNIIVSKGRKIPSRAMAAVAVQQTEAVHPGQEGAAWIIELEKKLFEAKVLTTGRAIVRGDRPAFHILVVNLENRPTFVHQGTVLGEIAEIEEDMVEFEDVVETEGFRKLTKEAETEGGWRETGGRPEGQATRSTTKKESFPATRTWISGSRFPLS